MTLDDIKNDVYWLALLKLYGFDNEINFDEESNKILEELNKIMMLLLHPISYMCYPQHIEKLYTDYGYDVYNNGVKRFEEELRPLAENVDCSGGGEGSGEQVYGVFRLGDKFYRCDWTYYSHYGFGGAWEEERLFQELRQVFPREVVMTVYD